MRINLRCPFQDKDLAKQLGARWDSKLRIWYIENKDDLTPFARWLPGSDGAGGGAPAARGGLAAVSPSERASSRAAPSDRHGPVVTGPALVGDCGCPALPWESCDCAVGLVSGARS